MKFKIQDIKKYQIDDIEVEEIKIYYVEAKDVDYAFDKLDEALNKDIECIVTTIEDDSE